MTRRRAALAPDRYERALAAGAVLLTGAVLVALVRGRAHWGAVPVTVWAHLLSILFALILTPVLLLRARGTAQHRWLGTIWVVAMLATALVSLFVHSGPGPFGPIHILSAATLILVPVLWRSARRHDIAGHRRAVRGVVTGALLIAGFFTFPFHRLLGTWLFG